MVRKGLEVVKMKRWKTMDNVFLIVIGLIIFFAYMDSNQIIPFLSINTPEIWVLYNQYTGPAIWSLWYVVILAIGVIWYLVYKDKSEAVALTIAGWTLMFFGTQDIFYFIFSGQAMTSSMCWADGMIPIRTISDILGECCPTALSFIISAVIGLFLSYKLYHYFKEARW